MKDGGQRMTNHEPLVATKALDALSTSSAFRTRGIGILGTV